MATPYDFTSIRILESVGESDNEPGKRLAGQLETLFDIRYTFILDRKQLMAELAEVRSYALKGGIPVVHIEAHGGAAGIRLRSGEQLSWEELASEFRSINIATKFNLLVGLSCCDGTKQLRAIPPDKVCPFAGLIGCEGVVDTEPLLQGFGEFYERLIRIGNVREAASAMGVYVSGQSFARVHFFSAEQTYHEAREITLQQSQDTGRALARFDRLRGGINHIRTSKGNSIPVTFEEVSSLSMAADRPVLERYFNAFFGIADIPGNADRFKHLVDF